MSNKQETLFEEEQMTEMKRKRKKIANIPLSPDRLEEVLKNKGVKITAEEALRMIGMSHTAIRETLNRCAIKKSTAEHLRDKFGIAPEEYAPDIKAQTTDPEAAAPDATIDILESIKGSIERILINMTIAAAMDLGRKSARDIEGLKPEPEKEIQLLIEIEDAFKAGMGIKERILAQSRKEADA